jgi:hypothetical protein
MRAGTAVALVIAIAVLAAGLAPGALLDTAQSVRF